MQTKPLAWVVDDSPVEIDVARRALAHYETAAFVDGATLLEALSVAARRPDVLVLDWQMPGVSGIEVCHFLRAQPETSELPILLLTGNQQTEDIIEGLAAGANDYVTKPFSPSELAARVEALLRSKRLRERAERAEFDLRSVLEELPEALLVVDAQQRILFGNAMIENVFACPRVELVGKSMSELIPGLLVDDVLLDPSLPHLDDVTIRERIYSPALRTVRLGETAASVLVTLRDVTEKRRLEARRLDFYSIIAHDLRSPLSSMHLRTSLMLDGAHGELPPLVKKDVHKLADRITDMVALINDFLDLARLEGAAIRIERAPVDLVAIARAMIDDLMPSAETRQLTLAVEASASSLMVLGDERRLAQVFTNLISNAIKFTPSGGRVMVQMKNVQDAIEVAVVDTGRGVAPEILATIFQRYVRGVPEPGDAVSTGLGLMIVKEIVEGHGGSIGVDSTVGSGSRFWFRLPVAKASST